VKLLWGAKDGGAESHVWCWGIESKSLGSVLLLKFALGSREAFHTHAFNAISWILSGTLLERFLSCKGNEVHVPSVKPVVTLRETFHMVTGLASNTWVVTIRGPWSETWREYLPNKLRSLVLTHGRKEVL
jgi:hypothetical protein